MLFAVTKNTVCKLILVSRKIGISKDLVDQMAFYMRSFGQQVSDKLGRMERSGGYQRGERGDMDVLLNLRTGLMNVEKRQGG
jgi:hypothetical protein